jgi:alkyl hydroperoxide reductase subunit F
MNGEVHRDPVCGMEVESTKFSIEYEGKSYFFCSQGCLDKFNRAPGDFAFKNSYDLIIIGGGPAGLTAAVYASLSRIDTLLITTEIGGQAIDSSKIKNYMGYEFITGTELIKKFQDQFLNEHYLAHKIDKVIRLEKNSGKYEILTRGKDRIKAKAIIIATGMKKRKLGIPGEDRLQRKGISYSSVHDIGLFKGLDIVVIGGGNSGLQTAEELLKIGCRVTIVTQGKMIADPENIDKLKNKSGLRILEGYDAIEILGEDKVEGMVIQSEEGLETLKLLCKAVFIQVGFVPNTEFCLNLLALNREGEIIIDQDCSTNVDGIFACGDVTNVPGKRIIIASGEGAKSVLSAKKFLSRIDK